MTTSSAASPATTAQTTAPACPPRTSVTRLTEEDCRARLEAAYAQFPELRDLRRDCCSGCVESDLAAVHGWGSPILKAWDEVTSMRFLLDIDP